MAIDQGDFSSSFAALLEMPDLQLAQFQRVRRQVPLRGHLLDVCYR